MLRPNDKNTRVLMVTYGDLSIKIEGYNDPFTLFKQINDYYRGISENFNDNTMDTPSNDSSELSLATTMKSTKPVKKILQKSKKDTKPFKINDFLNPSLTVPMDKSSETKENINIIRPKLDRDYISSRQKQNESHPAKLPKQDAIGNVPKTPPTKANLGNKIKYKKTNYKRLKLNNENNKKDPLVLVTM